MPCWVSHRGLASCSCFDPARAVMLTYAYVCPTFAHAMNTDAGAQLPRCAVRVLHDMQATMTMENSGRRAKRACHSRTTVQPSTEQRTAAMARLHR